MLDATYTCQFRIKHPFADSAYDRSYLLEKTAYLDFTVEIMKRIEAAFVALQR